MKYLYKINREPGREIFDRVADVWLTVSREQDVFGRIGWSVDAEGFAQTLAAEDCKNVMLTGFRDGDIQRLLPHMGNVEYLSLFKCKDLTSLGFLEQLPNLQAVNIYWNRKVTALWNASRNPHLQRLRLDCANKLTDFSGLMGTTIQLLEIRSDLPGDPRPKLQIGDYTFLTAMPQLRELELLLIPNPDASELAVLGSLTQLERLGLWSTYCAQQRAWLQTQLPNTQMGDV